MNVPEPASSAANQRHASLFRQMVLSAARSWAFTQIPDEGLDPTVVLLRILRRQEALLLGDETHEQLQEATVLIQLLLELCEGGPDRRIVQSRFTGPEWAERLNRIYAAAKRRGEAM